MVLQPSAFCKVYDNKSQLSLNLDNNTSLRGSDSIELLVNGQLATKTNIVYLFLDSGQ